MPFQELPHTADWSLRVWAADLPALFVEAASGMNTLSGAQAAPGPLVERTVALSAADVETLLVAFLSELLYLTEQERLAFDKVHVNLVESPGEWRLKAKLTGAPLVSLTRAIKAVTFHNLRIENTARGVQVEIVFDV